ncbi:MFS transporter [Actinomadura namibiensis]|uniref:MFS transporter n=1 Tax=Actinomadura kijaniata TaxID=46161 RepID=UPI00361468AC
MLAPVTLTVLTAAFPEGPARVRALATWAAVGLTGGAAGNLLAGALTETLSWRAILLVNVPVGALALPVAARLLTDAPRRSRRLDLPGAVLATTGLTCLVYGLSQARARGWDHPAPVAASAAALLLLAAFALAERHAPSPLVPPRLLRSRAVAVGNLVTLLAGACFQIPLWYFLSLYLHHALGYTAMQTGAAFLPHTLLTLLVGLRVTPALMRRAGDRTLIVAGALAAAAGFGWQSLIGPGDGYLTGVLGPAVLISVGGGLFTTPLTAVVTSGVPEADAGVASGLLNTAKQVGGAVGLAALTALAPDTADPGRAFLACAGLLAACAALALALPSAGRDQQPFGGAGEQARLDGGEPVGPAR